MDKYIEETKETTGYWKKTTKYHVDTEGGFYYFDIVCSKCGERPEKTWHLTKYCPNCGTYMKGVIENGEEIG